MVKAVLFDLFETLVTESRTRPPGVSSLAPSLGCERDAFRREWKARRPDVTTGRLSFRQAIKDVTSALGCPADESTLQKICEQRLRAKAEPFEQIEDHIIFMVDGLRSRGLRLGVVSNCIAEDVAAWPHSPIAARVGCAVFSFEAGLAKPDPEIYRVATRRLNVDVAHTWFVGDGESDELSGAEHAGLRPLRATWFLRRWPHFRDEPGAFAHVTTTVELVTLVEHALDGPPAP
jgi:putative hydrolase of the HAD superfamily